MQHGIEGLWTFEVATLDGWTTSGALVLTGGRVLGGSDRYYYVGTYRERGQVFEGEARVFHFHGPTANAFGSNSPDFHVVFRGRRLSDVIDGEMHRPESPHMTRPFRLSWRAAMT